MPSQTPLSYFLLNFALLFFPLISLSVKQKNLKDNLIEFGPWKQMKKESRKKEKQRKGIKKVKKYSILKSIPSIESQAKYVLS